MIFHRKNIVVKIRITNMNMNKLTVDIKNILLTKMDQEDATELLEEIMGKISSIKLVNTKTSPAKKKKDKNEEENKTRALVVIVFRK